MWCSGCAKEHTGAVSLDTRKCVECQLKMANFGMPSDGKRMWCGGCAKQHEGAVNVVTKKCEDCRLVVPSLGLPGEGRKRWCVGCAKGHAGATNVNKKCEGCSLKHYLKRGTALTLSNPP
jgi:hypothetical protein